MRREIGRVAVVRVGICRCRPSACVWVGDAGRSLARSINRWCELASALLFTSISLLYRAAAAAAAGSFGSSDPLAVDRRFLILPPGKPDLRLIGLPVSK